MSIRIKFYLVLLFSVVRNQVVVDLHVDVVVGTQSSSVGGAVALGVDRLVGGPATRCRPCAGYGRASLKGRALNLVEGVLDVVAVWDGV